jgi:hypothetical protein
MKNGMDRQFFFVPEYFRGNVPVYTVGYTAIMGLCEMKCNSIIQESRMDSGLYGFDDTC